MKKSIISIVVLGLSLQTYILGQTFPNLFNITGNAESVSPISTEESKAFQTDLFTGAAIYNFSIEIPGGTGGLQPGLSLSYSSNSPNNWSGMGWSIGFASIERSTKYGVPEYGTEDTYVLNGQELVWCTVHNWWHTKIESFSKIVKNGDDWISTSKGGTKSFYGRSSNSRVAGPRGTARWLLDKVQDTHDNYFEIEYDRNTDAGFAYPQLITYTKNYVANPTLTKFRTIEFVLENRPDVILSYRQGFPEMISKRLKEIIIRIDGDLVRKYLFNYQVSAASGKSLLKSITQYGNDGVSSLPPTEFEYGYNQSKGFVQSSGWTIPIPLGFSNGVDYGTRVLDINGDGLADIINARQGINQQVFINDGTRWVEEWVNWQLPSGIWFTTSSNRDTGVRLADINGDGLVDILKYKEGAGSPKAHLNNGSGWGPDDSNWHPPSGIYFTFSDGGDMGVRLLDVNGDSKIDLLKYIEGSPPKTYLSTGTTWLLKPEWDSPFRFAYSNGKDMGVRHTDLNGDGLIDVLKGLSQTSMSDLNNGAGWTSDFPNWHTTEMFTASNGTDRGVRLVDINNDGQVDILKFAEGSISKAYINTTNGWHEDNNWASPEAFIFSNGPSRGVQMGDANGDGLIDILKYLQDSTPKVYLNRGSGDVDNLVRIKNPIGGEIEIEYLRSTMRTNTKLPFALRTVKKVTKKDGLGNSSSSSYQFSGGLYDFSAKEFRGFSKVEVTDPENNITTQEFHQGEFLKGKPIRTSFEDNLGNNYSESSFDWDLSGNCDGVRAVLLREEQSILHNPIAGTRVRSGIRYNGYDQYGNLNSKRYLGDLDLPGDEYERHTEYAYNTSKWIVSFPSHIYITDESGTKLQETWYYYDNSTLGTIVKGDLTRTEYWNNRGDNPIITRTYDDFGNLLTETDAEANKNSRGPTQIIEYDSDYHTFPQVITDVMGFRVQYLYNPALGQWTKMTDINGKIFGKSYDVFGRIKKLVGPYDLSSPFGAVTYDYLDYGTVGNQRLRLSRTERYGQADVLWNEVYFDGLGRIIKRVSKGINGNDIYQEVTYDSRGLHKKVSLPHFQNESAQWVISQYDPLGRPTQLELPSGGRVKYIYDLRTTIIEDPEGNSKIYIKDVYDRGIETREKNGAQVSITKYFYDPLDNLRKVVDPKGNEILTYYSSLSRKTSIKDPDLGKWIFLYDLNGNLVKQTDNKGYEIKFFYDNLNRISRKEYPDHSIEEFFYDRYPVLPGNDCGSQRTIDRGENLLGRLTMVKEKDITTKYHYDKVGRVTKTERKINNSWYSVESEYDALDRVTKLIYPDGETVEITYEQSGKILKMDGRFPYIKNIKYSSTGQFESIAYGNETSTKYFYNSQTSFLDSLVAVKNTGELIQNFAYTYDLVGNVRKINDYINTASQEFNYDNLYRLINATGGYGNLNFTYDALGNIKSKGARQYYYDGNQPHAVTRTSSGLNLTYDSNGNLSTKGENEYQYDYNNRLKRVFKQRSDGSKELISEFSYDYLGQRIKKRTTSKTILYLNRFAELDLSGEKITKYYYVGSKLVASNVENFSASASVMSGVGTRFFHDQPMFGFLLPLLFLLLLRLRHTFLLFLRGMNPRKLIASLLIVTLLGQSCTCYAVSAPKSVPPLTGPVYYHSDHLSSTNLVTDERGNVVKHYEYYPFGEINVEQGSEDAVHKYTSKRFDAEVDLYFLGARYYDPDLGRFIQPDPIIPQIDNPQAFNRYAYVYNNPLKYLDPSGQIPVLALFVGVFLGAWVSGVGYAVVSELSGQRGSQSGFLKAVLGGAITGGFGAVGTSIGLSVAFGALGSTVSHTAVSLASGGDISFESMIGAVLGGAVGGFIPGFSGIEGGGTLENVVGEIGHNAATGALAGGIGGGITAILSGENVISGAAVGAQRGFIGGAARAAFNIIAFGSAYRPTSNIRDKLDRMEDVLGKNLGSNRPVYRTGGVVGLLIGSTPGITLGRNLIVKNQQDAGLTIHETFHYFQQLDKGTLPFLATGAYEQWIMRWIQGTDIYNTPGTQEWDADIAEIIFNF
ncbi:MAG: FG-GAP-like repeat-containing protein [Calditrichia bacterium]|nr:FG-GAP-like repeat-containing protein [Calditrichia bacterium]